MSRKKQDAPAAQALPDERLGKLARTLGLGEGSLALLRTAITHSSFSEASGQDNYERIEYLGDAVLQLAIGHCLYAAEPPLPEGRMSRLRAAIVSEASLAACARRLGLSDCLQLGFGERKSGGADRSSILADVVESLFAVVYLEKGLDDARRVIEEWLAPEIRQAFQDELAGDHKTRFQELVQRQGSVTIRYNVLRSWGPDHDKRFEAEVTVDDERFGVGIGATRKEAEQRAAEQALARCERQRG